MLLLLLLLEATFVGADNGNGVGCGDGDFVAPNAEEGIPPFKLSDLLLSLLLFFIFVLFLF